MSDTSVFIKNLLDSVDLDTVSVLNSISIVDFQNQQGGGINDYTSETDSYLTTTNDVEYGKKKNKKSKKKDSLFKTRKIVENDSDDEINDSSSSSIEDSMDSTSDSVTMSSDKYPLFNYYGSITKKSKSKRGRVGSNKSTKVKKQVGGTRKLRN